MDRWRAGVAVLSLVLLIACSDDPTGTVRVDRVEVEAADQVLVVGDSTTITAVPRTTSGEAVTGVVLWRSLSPTVATVRVSGSTAVVAAKGAGVARIEAESGGRTGFVNVTVVAAPQVTVVTLLPAELVLEMGQEATIQAVAGTAGGEVIAGRPVTWTVTGTGVTVEPETTPGWATVTAHTNGTAVVRATIDGIAGEADVEVVTTAPPPAQVASVEITPTGFSLPVNHETSLQAIARDAFGNVIAGLPVTWMSTVSSVASVTPIGVSPFANLLAKSAGTTVIRATISGVSAEMTFTVTATVPPPNEVLYLFFSASRRGIWANQLLDFRPFLTVYGRNGPVENPLVSWSIDEEALQIARSFGQDRELAVALQTYATVLIGIGQARMAEGMVVESLQALRRDPSHLFIARAIDYYAYTRAERDPERAARAIGVAAAMRQHIGANRFPHDDALITRLIARLRETLGEDSYERAFADGMRVQPGDAIDEVLGSASQRALGMGPVDDPATTAHRVDTHATAVQSAEADAVQSAEADMARHAMPRQSIARQAAAPAVAAAAGNAEPSPVAADLVVCALGPFEVSVQGRRIETWPYAKPKELLVLLLLHPDGRTRAEIGNALWPAAAPAQVRNSFHVTMHHVRRTLGHADWIVLTGDRYAIAPGISVAFDVAAFQQQVRAALSMSGAVAIDALRAAMPLYRGHFLAGESVGAWRDDVQDRLRRDFCDAGVKLGALLEVAGDDSGAADAYESVVLCEPLHETAHRGLLLTMARAGRRAQALRHFDRLSALLRDLELEPEDETMELYERIRNADIMHRAQDLAMRTD